MRWVALLLLLANLGVVAWGVRQAPNTPGLRVVAGESIGSMRLLAEVGTTQGTPGTPVPERVTAEPPGSAAAPRGALPVAPELPRAVAAEVVSEPPAVETDEPIESAGSDESVSGSGREELPRIAVESRVDVTPASLLPETPALAASGSVPESLPLQASNSAVQEGANPQRESPLAPLVQQPQSEPESEPELEPVPEVEAEPKVVNTAECGILGPIEAGTTARGIVVDLEALGVDASLRRESVVRDTGYWVVIPPYGSAQEARDAVTQLQGQGIKDIRRFFKGEQKNGVSLGVFSSRSNAERRRRQIVAKGFPAQILPRRREVPLHWIDYRTSSEALKQGVRRISARHSGLQMREAPCPRIVTRRGIL